MTTKVRVTKSHAICRHDGRACDVDDRIRLAR
jgi:hypothetical protein